MWLGATDVVKEGTWIWESSKTTMTYSHWNAGEPNNGNGHGAENCLHFWDQNGTWNDAPCSDIISALCEMVFPC
jgi:hypothetical protein